MELIEAHGVRLHYQLAGPAGQPVVMLSNALGANLAMWDLQMPVLTQHFQVLRYDTRGLGASEETPGPYTIERLGQDVLGILDGLGIGRVRFCGLSMGGTTGIWLGAHASERLEKLALCSTMARFGTEASWDRRIAAIREDGMEAIADATIARWFRPETMARQPDQVASVRNMLLTASPEGYIANCAAMRNADPHPVVSSIRTPTLIMAGRNDPSAPAPEGRKLAEQIPAARFVELPAAHLASIDAAPAFTQALLQFLC